MGVTIECRKTKNSIDVGYGGFMKLRETIAHCACQELDSFYNDLYRDLCLGLPIEKYFEKIEKVVNEGKLSPKVADFLLASDCGGECTYGTCKDILKAIGDYDDNIRYGYAAHSNAATFKDFKAILKDCVETKRKMYWW